MIVKKDDLELFEAFCCYMHPNAIADDVDDNDNYFEMKYIHRVSMHRWPFDAVA
jgi:hypothetical protein